MSTPEGGPFPGSDFHTRYPEDMTEITRHFTATTFVVRDGKVLLHRHPKQGLWLPPGGHIDRDELPDDAARREVLEETGLSVRLHSEEESATLANEMHARVVAQPAFVLVEDINPFHQHIDFIYYALAPLGQEPGGEGGFQWFAPGTLPTEGVPENVRAGAERAVTWEQSGLTTT